MRDRQHPHPDLLLRFLDGEATRTETRAVVRHLLAGCAACSATIRKTWQLPEWPVPRGRPPLRPAPRFELVHGGRA